MSDNSDINAKLAVIRKAYIMELPRKAADLEQAWRTAEASAWQQVQVQELHRLVHNLAGSGATFGFTVVSECARTLDGALRALLQPDAIEGVEAGHNRLHVLYAALIAAVQHAAEAQ